MGVCLGLLPTKGSAATVHQLRRLVTAGLDDRNGAVTQRIAALELMWTVVADATQDRLRGWRYGRPPLSRAVRRRRTAPAAPQARSRSSAPRRGVEQRLVPRRPATRCVRCVPVRAQGHAARPGKRVAGGAAGWAVLRVPRLVASDSAATWSSVWAATRRDPRWRLAATILRSRRW